MISAHSKDNGSPTSVAHKLDQTDSVVVRRDDLVVVDNAALGTLCEDVQIASRRNAGVLSEAIRVTGMYTYGRVELEPRGAPPPPGWTELMLAMHHQEPVGRCFQR